MKMTHGWISKQIREFEEILFRLEDTENDRKLKTIYAERVRTLRATLAVVELEMKVLAD